MIDAGNFIGSLDSALKVGHDNYCNEITRSFISDAVVWAAINTLKSLEAEGAAVLILSNSKISFGHGVCYLQDISDFYFPSIIHGICASFGLCLEGYKSSQDFERLSDTKINNVRDIITPFTGSVITISDRLQGLSKQWIIDNIPF